jgi:LacI family transcriptional regulator
MEEARPTMNDVARTAGVSLKTVSRVVNGEPTVAPDLAARVHAAVELLNYRPNLGASMLRRNDRRSRTIGVLVEDVGNPFSAALHRAIEDEARPRGVHVLTGSLDEDAQRERDLTREFA